MYACFQIEAKFKKQEEELRLEEARLEEEREAERREEQRLQEELAKMNLSYSPRVNL